MISDYMTCAENIYYFIFIYSAARELYFLQIQLDHATVLPNSTLQLTVILGREVDEKQKFSGKSHHIQQLIKTNLIY